MILMDMLTKEEGWWNVGELPPAAQAAVLPAIRGALKEAHNIPLSNWKKGGALGDCRFQNTFVKRETHFLALKSASRRPFLSKQRIQVVTEKHVKEQCLSVEDLPFFERDALMTGASR